MHNVLVSIVIPVYNGGNYLASAIDSALAQTYPHCEIIVVNDGSTDGGETERIALGYGNRIRYFRQENGGVGAALNEGVRQMRGEYFSWLSHDDYYLADHVLRELQAIPDERPETLVFGNYTYFDTLTGHSLPVNMEKRYTKRQLSVPLFPVVFQLIHGCALLIHRSHFTRVGLFDEAQRTTQDYDMWFRLFRGSHTLHCPHNGLVSRLHPQAGNQTIPEFIDDACAFLIRTDQALTDAERARISGTPHRYYTQMYENVANTKYAAAKRYFSAAAQGDPFRYGCRTRDEKAELYRTLVQNCGEQPPAKPQPDMNAAESGAELDGQIRAAMERFYRLLSAKAERHMRRPQWGPATRIKRALRRYGWLGTLRKGLSKVLPGKPAPRE